MRKIWMLLLFCSLIPLVQAQSTPVLLFSDMTSAPKTGWDGSATKGAAVTIWGYNLGSSRGSNYVTVNGVDLDDDTDYAVWGEYWPTPYWQRITFWLNSNMADGAGIITVTVGGETSNSLDFTIREGNISFMAEVPAGGNGSLDDPLNYEHLRKNGGGHMETATPGDIIYLRAGNYLNYRHWVRSKWVNGTLDKPIALIGYPGETPRIYSDIHYSKSTSIAISMEGTVISGLFIDSHYKALGADADDARIVGNDFVGHKQGPSGGGSGIVTSGANRAVILGNAMHGGDTGNRLDHSLYIQGCAPEGGAIVGWNYLHGSDFGRGPILSVNHQDQPGGSGPLDRCKSGETMDSHYIFSNIIDCSHRRAVGINVYEMSYKPGEPDPEPAYVYNNLFLYCGTEDHSDSQVDNARVIIHENGHARFYHNVLYGTHYGAFFMRDRNHLSTQFRNNIVYMGDNNGTYIQFGHEHIKPNVDLSNNLYYGVGAYTPCATCGQDDNNVNNEDPLFVDPANGDFSLLADSPAINASTSITFDVPPPAWASMDRDMKYMMRTGVYDIGALEHSGGSVGSNQSSQQAVNRSPVLNHYFPPSFNKMNQSKKRVFTVNVSDADNDTLSYSWKVNGIEAGIVSSFELNGSLYQKGHMNISVNVTDGNSTVSYQWQFKLRTPKKQDITDDDTVDIADLTIVARHVIKKKGFNQQYDQNEDGVVNIFDLINIINQFGAY